MKNARTGNAHAAVVCLKRISLHCVSMFVGLLTCAAVVAHGAEAGEGHRNNVFRVSSVRVARKLLPEKTRLEILRQKAGDEIESAPLNYPHLVACRFHPFITAVHHAFAEHRPLIISPDMIWLMILQGMGDHIRARPDAFHDQWFCHEGKLNLLVRRPLLGRHAPVTAWENVLPEFLDKIEEHCHGDIIDILRTRFSTTTPATSAAHSIALMSAMDSYFTYTVASLCGVPWIRLEGTAGDWALLRERAKSLASYDLEWWTDYLVPVLDEFCNAARGRVNLSFWRSIYKNQGQSGRGDAVTGWVLVFFPYVLDCEDKMVANKYLNGNWKQRVHHGLELGEFPRGMTKVAFKWRCDTAVMDMEMLSGFFGIAQDRKTMALRPAISWVIRRYALEGGSEVEKHLTVKKRAATMAAHLQKILPPGWRTLHCRTKVYIFSGGKYVSDDLEEDIPLIQLRFAQKLSAPERAAARAGYEKRRQRIRQLRKILKARGLLEPGITYDDVPEPIRPAFDEYGHLTRSLSKYRPPAYFRRDMDVYWRDNLEYLKQENKQKEHDKLKTIIPLIRNELAPYGE